MLLHLIGSNHLTGQVASQPAAADRVACGCQTDVSMPTMANRLVQSTVYPTVRREWVWIVVFGALNSPISTTFAVGTFLHCDSLFLLQCSSTDQVSRYEGVDSIVDVWILVVFLSSRIC